MSLTQNKGEARKSKRKNAMKPKARFVKSVTETTRKTEIEMPWTRGARRAAMIARRDEAQAPKRVLRSA